MEEKGDVYMSLLSHRSFSCTKGRLKTVVCQIRAKTHFLMTAFVRFNEAKRSPIISCPGCHVEIYKILHLLCITESPLHSHLSQQLSSSVVSIVLYSRFWIMKILSE